MNPTTSTAADNPMPLTDAQIEDACRLTKEQCVAEALQLRTDLLGDINRAGGATAVPLDELDLKAYRQAINPLCRAIAAGQIPPGAGEIFDLRTAIRAMPFRPRYPEVAALVAKAMGARMLPGENSDAYRVVTTPADYGRPALPAPSNGHSKDGRSGKNPARDAARALVERLKQATASSALTEEFAPIAQKLGAQIYTERHALNWSPGPGQPHPVMTIPFEEREEYVIKAFASLQKRMKGTHPLAVHIEAARLWRISSVINISSVEQAND